MAAAAEQETTLAARHRLAQANAATSTLSQQLADARIRLATRHHLDRLVDHRVSEGLQQDDANYARKLLDRANQLRQEVDARTRTRVVATAVVNAIDQQVLTINYLAAAATTTAPRQSDNQEITSNLLKRKDDLSFRLLSVRKDLRSTTLERTKLRRHLHALNRDNAISVAFLEKRTEPPLLASAAAKELVAPLSPPLQAYHASLNDALIVTSAKLVRLNHIFQKLVAELALPLHTCPLPSSSTMSAMPRLDRDAPPSPPPPPPPSAKAFSSAVEETPTRTSHPTRTRIPEVATEANLRDVEMRQEQPGDNDHQQRGRRREEEEEEELQGAEGMWLTPSKLLELVLLAGRHVDEEFDRPTDDDDYNPSDDEEEATRTTTQVEGQDDNDDFELLAGERLDEAGEEVKAEMKEWERIRTERDPWLVARRKEREREKRGLASS